MMENGICPGDELWKFSIDSDFTLPTQWVERGARGVHLKAHAAIMIHVGWSPDVEGHRKLDLEAIQTWSTFLVVEA